MHTGLCQRRLSQRGLSRRQLLRQFACGFGHVALLGLAATENKAAVGGETTLGPHRAGIPDHQAKAKRVIFIFLHGGLSHVDSFDPKPELTKWDGKPLPFDKPKFNFAETGNLLKSPWGFKRYGQSGIQVSDLFPHIGQCIDDISVIRSMKGDQVAHGGGCLLLHTGHGVFIRPSMGAWIQYGLGTENRSLPGFITLSPTAYHGGAQMYGSSFLPAAFQGTRIGDGSTPFDQAKLANLTMAERSRQLQRMQLDFLGEENREHLYRVGEDTRLNARISAYELAFRMQMEAPNAMDTSEETKSTEGLYGIGEGPTDEFGRQCLLARRFSEHGVRFVQVSHSYPRNYWDAHGGLRENHEKNAQKVDKPIAGLLKDLKQRGMLDETLVVMGTEFGRTPAAQGRDGRDHHPHAYSMWMAGGGVRGGVTYGRTDEFGYYVTEDLVTMPDFHATLLHLLGIEHTKLTYRYSGRDFRLTDVSGKVLQKILV